MFVRRRKIVDEIRFKEDLTKLGLFINKEDKIRQIANPEEPFQYKVFKNPRWNERRREAVDACLRRIVLERLHNECGLEMVQCVKGTSHAHVPILVSKDLESNKEKCLMLFPGENADLGFWSLRGVGEWGIEKGSMIHTVKAAQKIGYSIVIANTGALRYDPELGRTVTSITWGARKKPWRLGGMIRDWDPTWNSVPGNETMSEHAEWIFENILSKRVPKEAKVMVAAMDLAGFNLVEYLDREDNFDKFASQLHAFVLTNPSHYHTNIKNPKLQNFWFKYTRAYLTTYVPDPNSTSETVPEEETLPHPTLGEQLSDGRFGCAVFNSMQIYPEMVMAPVIDLALEYFELSLIDRDNCNPTVHIDIDESLLAHREETERDLVECEYKADDFPSWDGLVAAGSEPPTVELTGNVGAGGVHLNGAKTASAENAEAAIEEIED